MPYQEPGEFSDEEVNDQFAELTQHLDLGEFVSDPRDAVSVAMLDDAELVSRFTLCREELFKLGEMLTPKTQRGRDLHSARAAYLIEMRRRRLR